LNESLERIRVEQVRVGVYIELESWMDHPFLFSSFKVRNDKQLQILRSLGVTHVRYDSARSDRTPLPPPDAAAPPPPAPPPLPDPEIAAMWAEKQARRGQMLAQRGALSRCEKKFAAGVVAVKDIQRKLFSRPAESFGQAQALVSEMVETIIEDKNVALHLMNVKSGDESAYFHAINATVLALILGRQARLDADELRALGLGMLLHDIGKEKVPSQVLLKKELWTTAERNFYMQHVAYGVEMARLLPGIPEAALEVIAQHHELLDGSGYPDRLKGDQIGRFARIASIANSFDNYCSGTNGAEPMTPTDALALMFKNEKGKYDAELLQGFVRSMGVYPPGSVVQLSTGQVGMVMCVNPDQLLSPTLLLYDPEVPKEEAVWIDLGQTPALTVVKALRGADLSRAAQDYLDPRARVSYYPENSRTGTDKPASGRV
jgi:putative nucleotidyltransferase with HDIG domain